MGRTLRLAVLVLASSPAFAELPARPLPAVAGAAAFRPVTPRQAEFLAAVENWREIVPKDPADPIHKRHAPKLEEIRSEASTKEAAKALGPVEERFEGWKKAFLKDLYQRTHYDFFSDPKRFEKYMQERLALIEELRSREKRSVDPAKLRDYEDLKARVGEAPDWSTLDRVFDKLGLRRKPLFFSSKPEDAPKESKAKDVVFSEARNIKPEDLPAPPSPSPLAGVPMDAAAYARLREHLVGHGVRAQIVDMVFEESAAQGVDPLLVLAVIKTESYFNPRATSPANARGLMQLIDPTARMMGISNPEVNSYDPKLNLKGGIKFLNHLKGYLKDKFGVDINLADFSSNDPWNRDEVKALIASYNAGPGRAFKWKGIKETSRYVPKVLGFYTEYQRVAGEAVSPPSA